MSLHLMPACGDDELAWLRTRWAATGKKLDMGRSCIRFKKLEDLPLEVIGEAIRRMPARTYVARYLAVLEAQGIRHKGLAAAPATRAAGSLPKPVTSRRAASTPAREAVTLTRATPERSAAPGGAKSRAVAGRTAGARRAGVAPRRTTDPSRRVPVKRPR
jgi:hypothetical protein